jgi:hypothetical protein
MRRLDVNLYSSRIKEIEYGDMDLIQLAQDKTQWRISVNERKDIRVP